MADLLRDRDCWSEHVRVHGLFEVIRPCLVDLRLGVVPQRAQCVGERSQAFAEALVVDPAMNVALLCGLDRPA